MSVNSTSFLNTTSTYLSTQFGLKHLPEHFQSLVLSYLTFQALEFISHPVSSYLFGKRYLTLKRKAKIGWAEHVVSLVHASIVVPAAWYLRYRHEGRFNLLNDKAFGWDQSVGKLFSFSVGYFLWDTLHAIRNRSDVGFIAHGAVCLVVFLNGFSPFLAYYGTGFLLWEASTPLVDFHWFFDKLGMTGSLPQLINGIALLLTFFSVRIVYGGKLSLEFFETLNSIRNEMSPAEHYAYGLGNLALNFLNWLWFYKMVKALKKRFDSPPVPSATVNGNGKVDGHHAEQD